MNYSALDAAAIAQTWEWRNHAGQLKDMACRSMLLKLEQKGLICLPARQKSSNNCCAFRPVVPPMAQALIEPIESQLSMVLVQISKKVGARTWAP